MNKTVPVMHYDSKTMFLLYFILRCCILPIIPCDLNGVRVIYPIMHSAILKYLASRNKTRHASI